MSKGSWLVLARTNPLLKPIPKILKQKGLFFKTVDGKSVAKNLYEDIEHWDKLRKGESIPEIQEQRVLEKIKGKLLQNNNSELGKKNVKNKEKKILEIFDNSKNKTESRTSIAEKVSISMGVPCNRKLVRRVLNEKRSTKLNKLK